MELLVLKGMRVELLVLEGVRVELLVLEGVKVELLFLKGARVELFVLDRLRMELLLVLEGVMVENPCLGRSEGGTPCLGGEGETRYFGRDEGGTGVFLSNKPLKKNENHKTYFIIL